MRFNAQKAREFSGRVHTHTAELLSVERRIRQVCETGRTATEVTLSIKYGQTIISTLVNNGYRVDQLENRVVRISW